MRKLTAFTAMALAVAMTVLVGGAATNATAAMLTNSPWCYNHDSIAIIGGSTNTGYQTTGYPANPVANAGYYPTTYGWWKRFTAELSASYGVADDGVAFASYNYARNGASAINYLPGQAFADAVPDIAKHNPNLLVISVGTNEFMAQVTPYQFQTNLTALVDSVYEVTDATAILLTIQHQVGIDPAQTLYPWAQYAAAIYNVAVSRGTAMLDMRQVIPPSTYNGPNPSGLYANESPVRIHLSDAGQMVYAARYSAIANSC